MQSKQLRSRHLKHVRKLSHESLENRRMLVPHALLDVGPAFVMLDQALSGLGHAPLTPTEKLNFRDGVKANIKSIYNGFSQLEVEVDTDASRVSSGSWSTVPVSDVEVLQFKNSFHPEAVAISYVDYGNARGWKLDPNELISPEIGTIYGVNYITSLDSAVKQSGYDPHTRDVYIQAATNFMSNIAAHEFGHMWGLTHSDATIESGQGTDPITFSDGTVSNPRDTVMENGIASDGKIWRPLPLPTHAVGKLNHTRLFGPAGGQVVEVEPNNTLGDAEEISFTQTTPQGQRFKDLTVEASMTNGDVDMFIVSPDLHDWVTISVHSNAAKYAPPNGKAVGITFEVKFVEVIGNTRDDFERTLDLAAKAKETRDGKSDKYLRFRMREQDNGNGKFLPKVLITVTGANSGDYRLNVSTGEGAFITAERGFVASNGDLSVRLHVNELKWDEAVPARRYRISAGSIYQSPWQTWSPATGQRDFTVALPVGGVAYLSPVSVTYELLGNSTLTDGDPHTIAVELPNATPTNSSLKGGRLKISTEDSNDNVVISNVGSNIRVTVNGNIAGEYPSQDVDYIVSELGDGNDVVSNFTSHELYVAAGDGDFSLDAGNASLISTILLDNLYVNAGRLRVLVDQDLRSLSVSSGALLELGKIEETGGSRSVRVHGSNSNLISPSEALVLWGLAASGFYADISDGTNDGGGTGVNFESGTVASSTVNGLGLVVVDDIIGQSYEFREAILGDLDGDGDVSFDDFLVLDDNYNAIDAIWDQGDLNGDGVIDFDDFLLQSGNYGDFYQAAS